MSAFDRNRRMPTGNGEGRGTHLSEISGKGKGKGKHGVHTTSICVWEIGKELPAGISLRGALLGKGGENFQYIRAETGVRIWLTGRGSSNAEGAEDGEGAMCVVLSSREQGRLQTARKLVDDLVAGVREEGKRKECLTDARGRGDWRRETAKGRGKGKSAALSKYVAEQRQQMSKDEQEANQRMAQIQEEMVEERRQLRHEAPALDPRFRNNWNSADEFWAALEKSRNERGQLSADECAKRTGERFAKSASLASHRQEIRELSNQVRHLQSTRASLNVASITHSTARCCALFASGSCPFAPGQCPRGSHQEPAPPGETELFRKITRAKLRLVQQKWGDAGGPGQIINAWQIHNPRLEFLFRGAEASFLDMYGKMTDCIDAWHGSAEQNLVSIALNGFDPGRRCGQVHGAGEYFAKDPNVSIGYARGGSFMFLCKLLLGNDNEDHTWASGPQYYVIKQREGRMQALPTFLLQFASTSSVFFRQLTAELAVARDVVETGALAGQQRGGLFACEARRDAGMVASSTRHLWVGWLAPNLRFKDNDGIAEDVFEFLEGLIVKQVVPERNGARIGAFVLLEEPIDQAIFQDLTRRLYHGESTISVDDAQPNNPKQAGEICPRLTGPSKFCRGWNIRGHAAWQWGCSFAHPDEYRPTHDAKFVLENIASGSAKFDEIQTEMRRSMPQARIVRIQRSSNPNLERLYEQRRNFIHDKQGFALEKELWHGTSVDAIPVLLQHGLQPPADSVPSADCPSSGGRGLCTTLCGTDCKHCSQAHAWGKCHMYGLGVYLADLAQKSHQYVRKPRKGVYSMLLCRVCLGNPYLIESNLLSSAAMHDLCWCQDPSEFLESLAEDWSIATGHDSFYVKGQAGAQKQGLGVFNSEYIVFQPFQILPLYLVDYQL